MARFDVDRFVGDCVAAVTDEGDDAPSAIRELLREAVDDPAAIRAQVGDLVTVPTMTTWHRSDDLTVLHLVWPPGSDLSPHDHQMWAHIGLYAGREENHFYATSPDGRITPAGGRVLEAGDCLALGPEAVHRVANHSRMWTGAIHVYGGDFFAEPRRRWSLDTGRSEPFDAGAVRDHLEHRAELARLAEAHAT